MIDLLPARAFFRFEVPVRYCAKLPLINGDIRKWDESYRLPALCEVDEQEPFADAYLAWNEDWLMAAFDVTSHGGALQVDAEQWWKKDGLRLCVDTRDARDVRRATRFCRMFYFLPTGGGPSRKEPIAGYHKMNRAKEPPPHIDVSQIKLGVRLEKRGYALEAAIPATCLTGWDPVEHPRIGIFYKVKDVRQDGQHLTANDELGWNQDPSTWATGVLVR